MQKWEYMTFLRSRGWGADKVSSDPTWKIGRDWNVDLDKRLVELGDQGWELVAVSSRSSYLGGREAAAYAGVALDYSGFTSDEIWVFKRPKQ